MYGHKNTLCQKKKRILNHSALVRVNLYLYSRKRFENLSTNLYKKREEIIKSF